MCFTNPENIEALKNIENILKHARKGFYIFTAAKASTQYDVINRLKMDRLFVFDYSKEVKPYSYDDLVELINKNPETSKFIILNFHLALQKQNDIYNLNLSRDVLANHNKLWIFGMTQEMDNRLAKTAFDFYSYVMMKVRFKEEKNAEPVKNGFIEERSEIFDKELAYLLINDYENSINTAENTSPDFIAQTYGIIARLYYTIGNNIQALEYYNKELAIFKKIYGEESSHALTAQKNIEKLKNLVK